MQLQERRAGQAPAFEESMTAGASHEVSRTPAATSFVQDFTRLPVHAHEAVHDRDDEDAAVEEEDDERAEDEPSIVYGNWRDRLNTLIARMTNRDFRKQFRLWQASPNRYRIHRDPEAKDLLIDALPVPGKQQQHAAGHQHFEVPYRRIGFEGKPPKPPKPPKRRKDELHWGWGNRVENVHKGHVFSFGMGNYNRYNIVGGEQGGKKLQPEPNSLFGWVGSPRHGRPAPYILFARSLRNGR